MKILAVSTWFPFPPDNGSKIRAFYLLKALSKRHEVTMLSFSNTDVSEDLLAQLLDRGIKPIVEVVDPYVYAKTLPKVIQFVSPIPVAFWPIKRMKKASKQIAKEGEWESIVAFDVPAARYATLIRGVPRILDVDMSLSNYLFERYAIQKGYIEKIRSWVSWQKAHNYEKHLFRKFQTCTVVSRKELNFLENQVESTNSLVQVIPNGVDCNHNRLGLAPMVPETLIFNGALTYSANYDAMRYFLAESYPIIRQKAPNVSLTITGSARNVDLEGLRVDDSVHLSGYVDDIRPLVAGSTVCVTPLRQGGGTRLKILEAMALGTPVVSTTKGAEGLDVVGGKHLLLADDPVEFAESTLRLLHSPTLRQQLSADARRLVEQRYDWLQIGRQFVELVENTKIRYQE